MLYQYLSQYFSSSCRDSTWMDLQELSKANLVLFRPLHFCAAAFGLYWVVANLALSGCVVPVWHTVYSAGKYEVSHGLSPLLGFGEMRCVACLWGMVPRGSSYFSSEHTVYPPAGGYLVLSLLRLCGRCENGVNYTLMSNAGCVAAAQNIQWTIV